MIKPTKTEINKINLDKLPDEYLDWYIYWRGFYDIDFFINYFLGHYKIDKKTGKQVKDAKTHKKLRQLLLSNKDVLVVFPRDFAKSTNSFFIIIYQIVYKIEKHIGLVMSEGLGTETIGKIREEFETNEKIKYIFGRLVPNRTQQEANKKRTSKQLDFLNGVKIESLTLKGSIRGRRFTKIIVDDPQEDKDVRNVLITDRFIEWFFKSVYNVLDPSGNCVVIGTNVGELSFVNFLLTEKGNRGFEVIKFQAVNNPIFEIKEDGLKHLVKGNSIWKDKRSIKALDDRLQKIGRKIFQQEYMNNPFTLIGNPVFDLAVIEELKQTNPIRIDNKFSGLFIYKQPCECSRGIDLAMGNKDGDFTTIVARDIDYNKVFSFQGRIPRYSVVEIIDYLDELGYFGTKVIERNLGIANSIFDIAKDKPRFIDLYQEKTTGNVNDKETIKLGWWTSQKNKEKMIGELQLLVENKTIKEVDDREKNEMKFYIYDEKGSMNAMPGHHDDLIIADALCIQGLKDMYGLEI